MRRVHRRPRVASRIHKPTDQQNAFAYAFAPKQSLSSLTTTGASGANTSNQKSKTPLSGASASWISTKLPMSTSYDPSSKLPPQLPTTMRPHISCVRELLLEQDWTATSNCASAAAPTAPSQHKLTTHFPVHPPYTMRCRRGKCPAKDDATCHRCQKNSDVILGREMWNKTLLAPLVLYLWTANQYVLHLLSLLFPVRHTYTLDCCIMLY